MQARALAATLWSHPCGAVLVCASSLELFVDGRTCTARSGEAESDALYEEIGRLKVELDWLKKSWMLD